MDVSRRKLMIGSRFMSFKVDQESYCMDILRVKELMGMTSITPIPQTPEYIRGVINLRGLVIPIIDLRLKFGMPFLPYTKRTSIIVVEVEIKGELSYMGLVVDSISEVISIPEESITKAGFISARVKTDFIKGIANTSDGIVIILDVIKILSDDELEIVKGIRDKGEI